MTREDCLYVIRKMRSDYYSCPIVCHGVQDQIFLYESFKRWAVNELEAYISHCKTKDALSAMEEFRWFMDQCAVRAHTDSSNQLFSTAYDVVTDILDHIITYRGN